MSTVVAELYFNNSPTKNNRDLTEYLRRNLEVAIRKGNIKFRFHIAKTSDLARLRDAGIKRLPVMMLGKNQFVGVPNIVNELVRRVQTSKAPAPLKTDSEVLQDYFANTIGDVKKQGDGKIDVNAMDQESTEQMDFSGRLMRERDRRAGDQQVNPMEARTRPAPNKASRDHVQDDDYENREPPRNKQERPQYVARNDNIDPGDPIAALSRVQSQPGREKDDEMVMMMLGKIEQ